MISNASCSKSIRVHDVQTLVKSNAFQLQATPHSLVIVSRISSVLLAPATIFIIKQE